MNERSTVVDISAGVATRRVAIISSILKDGLKSSAQLEKEGKSFFGSVDHVPNNFISSRLVFPQNTYKDFSDSPVTFYGALYERGVSVLPVMAERPGVRHKSDPVNLAYSFHDVPWAGEEEKERVKQVLESRISSSFLVVVNETMKELYGKSKNFIFSSAKERFEKLEYIGRLKESTIFPDRFSYLIFPQDVWDGYRSQSNIDECLKIKLVRSGVKRKLFNRKLSLMLPDYESALVEILEERKEPIWVHGVRLPNEEDMSH